MQEAFALWLSQWQSIYDEDASTTERVGSSGSASSPAADKLARQVLQGIHDSWWLVSIVDNNYVDDSADVLDIFREAVLEAMPPPALRVRVRELELQAVALRDAHARLAEEHARVVAELATASDAERRAIAENTLLKSQLQALRGLGRQTQQSEIALSPVPLSRTVDSLAAALGRPTLPVLGPSMRL